MPSYSQDFRDIVINKYKAGFSEVGLSEFFDIDKRTVVSWIGLYNTTGDYIVNPIVFC